MDKKATWTVDLEGDWGGRVNTYDGINNGLPRILEIFEAYKIRSIFFISTEILDECPMVVSDIRAKGHVIGSHGHFHIKYKDAYRREQDRRISNAFLQANGRMKYIPYRAPWFYHSVPFEIFSYPINHVSVLRYSWGLKYIPEKPIFYIHPFDIVMPFGKSPNLYCKLLYSRPKKVRIAFEDLCAAYENDNELSGISNI